MLLATMTLLFLALPLLQNQQHQHNIMTTSSTAVFVAMAMVSPSGRHNNKPSRIAKRMVGDTTKDSAPTMMTRHDLFRNGTAASVAVVAVALLIGGITTTTAAPAPANAFDNRISNQYQDRPKQRGSKPKDLGVAANRIDLEGNEYVGLKPCGRAPNCFVSTVAVNDALDADHSIPPWKWPSSLSRQAAFDELLATLQAYQPGQGNIDGGGFQIVTADPKKADYIYVQYESLKNGYIDDVEFAILPDNNKDDDNDAVVQVRSSSRLGYLDFGVNAKRLNYIANALRQKGWDAPGVDYKTHPNYVIQNELE
jgi:uncharacterized protein (DUF1499 family)